MQSAGNHTDTKNKSSGYLVPVKDE